MSNYYQKPELTFALAKVVSKQAKGCLGLACGILTGVALASTIVIFKKKNDEDALHEALRREIEHIRATSPRNSMRKKKKMKPSRRKIRFADEMNQKLVHVREYAKNSPIYAC